LIKKSGLLELLNKGTNLSQQDDQKEILNLLIESGGNNLSIGEKQLICICRAALRKNKIVILDEATSNIDVITE